MTKIITRNTWVFARGRQPYEFIKDPRVFVTKQMNWERVNIAGFPNYTRWTGVEPDNYTHCIWHRHAVFIEHIEHQCWYRDYANGGWLSMYVVEDTDRFQDYLDNLDWWGHWRACRSNKPRLKISKIAHEHNIKWGKNAGRTLDERLYDLGHYDRLVALGCDPEWILKYAGPRPDTPLIMEADTTEEIDTLL
jgi:hypothetical protein